MAAVKPYEQQVAPDQAPTPYEAPNVSPSAYGGDIGQALETGGLQLAGAYQHAHARASAANVMRAVAQYGEQADNLLHDPNGGAFSLQGEAALGAFQPATEKLRKLQETAAKSLADPDQRAAFMQHSEGVLRTAVRQLQIHTSQQSEHLQVAGLDATQKSMADSAVKAIDQISADNYARLGEDATRAFWAARSNGKVADEKAREYSAAVNGARLDRLLANPDTAGEAIRFFQSRHDLLPADRLDTYEAKVAAVGVDQRAHPLALNILRASMGKDGQVDRRSAQGRIDVLKETEPIRAKVQQFVDHHANVYDKAWTDEAHALAAKVVDQARDPVIGEFSLATVNPADMAALELKWNDKANEIKKGVAVDGAKERYATSVEHFFGPDGWQDTARMTPQEFTTSSEILSLPPKHRTPLIERFQALQKRIGRPPPESIIIEEARKPLGLGKSGKIGSLSAEKQAAFADLFDVVKDDVREWTVVHNGQQPDREEVRKMVRANLGIVSDGWFSPTVRTYQQRKAQPGPGTAAASPVPVDQALPLPGAAPAGYRYTKDRRTRFAADAQGNVIGAAELAADGGVWP